MKLHRNSQKRYYDKNYVYSITVKTYQNYPYFKENILCDLLVEEIKLCKELKKFRLYAFCILYYHTHLLIQPSEEYNISKVMQFIKRHFTRDVNYITNHSTEGDIRECRLQGGEYERYVKIIKKYDRILKQLKIKFINKHGLGQTIIPKFRWQKSFYDHIIRDEKDLKNHYIYTVYNFKKHKLPDN